MVHTPSGTVGCTTHSLEDFLGNRYLPARVGVSRGTAVQLGVAVRRFSAWMGRPAMLEDLTQGNLLDWMRAMLQARTSAATVNSKRAAILALWREAADQGLVPPPTRIRKVPEPRRIPATFSLPQLASIFAAVRRLTGRWERVEVSRCWRVAILCSWDTACRLDTLLRARLLDVDTQQATWLVPAEHTKGKAADRLFRLHRQTVEAIWDTMPSGRELLFPFPHPRRRIWEHWRRILRSAGVPWDRGHMFHCLRRTAESYAARERGVEWAAEAVGHRPEVARKSYISPAICQPPALIEALPRPVV